MIPATLAPTVPGRDGPVVPTICRLSRDLTQLAFLAPKSDPTGVLDGATHVHMAQHDGRAWQVSPLSEMPGMSIRILPFWSTDSRAIALYVIDLQQHHSAIIGVPPSEGEGEILYTSDSVDAFITPAPHPDGRLIAMVRAHPMEAATTLVENRLGVGDPAEHSVAPIPPGHPSLWALR